MRCGLCSLCLANFSVMPSHFADNGSSPIPTIVHGALGITSIARQIPFRQSVLAVLIIRIFTRASSVTIPFSHLLLPPEIYLPIWRPSVP